MVTRPFISVCLFMFWSVRLPEQWASRPSVYTDYDPTYHMLAPAIFSTQACCRRTTPVYYGHRTTEMVHISNMVF